MKKQMKITAELIQDFSEAEKERARNNIGASPTPTHDKIAGGMCDVQNFERYDKILGLNNITNPLLPINTDTLKFEYFSYHAGSIFVTSKVDGQILITGTRHNLTTDSIVNDRLSINTTLNLTSDVRTSIANYGFSLSQQELGRNDYRIDWDLIITFRPGSGANFGSWWNPLRVKISRTPDLKIITG